MHSKTAHGRAEDIVCPLALSALTLSPMKVPERTGSTGTIALNGTAPEEGVPIEKGPTADGLDRIILSSSDDSAKLRLLASAIDEGRSSAFFTVTTDSVQPGTVVISASYKGATKTASLTVTAP
jgi:hypothetical protein